MVSTSALAKHTESIQLLNRQIETLTFKTVSAKYEFTDTFEEWLEKKSPSYTWRVPHLVFIRRHLTELLEGVYEDLLIFAPPRHGKSEMTTVRLPVYYLNKHSKRRVIVGAYNRELATMFARRSRRLAQEVLELDKSHQSVCDWAIRQGGEYFAVGVGSGVTGRGGDLIIVDDPVRSRKDANSEAFREECWYWFVEDLYTRREPGAKVVVIQTRWHEDDLSGRILASDFADDFAVISLPALAMEDDPLGRAEGEALWPERYNKKALQKIKKVTGVSFEALYQQQPAPPSGEIIQVDMIKSYEKLPTVSFTVLALDTAFKDKEENDFSVALVFAICRNGIYIIDRWKKKAKYPELKAEIRKLAHRYNVNALVIEDAASGQSLIQDFQAESRLNVIPIKVDSSKRSRANATTDTVNAERIRYPRNAPWWNDLKYNLAIFPFGKHDDDVDAFTLGINYITKRFANTFPVYQDYNDDMYCVESQPEDFVITEIRVGVYLDTMTTVVVTGVTEFSQVIVLNEFSQIGDTKDVIIKHVLPWVKRCYGSIVTRFNVYSDRKEYEWFNVLDDILDMQDISGAGTMALINNVEQVLSDIVKGKPALTLLGNYCSDLREGFFGAYCYKARDNVVNEEFHERPVKNKYSRVHIALQAAVFDYYMTKDEQYELPRDDDDYATGVDEVGGY